MNIVCDYMKMITTEEESLIRKKKPLTKIFAPHIIQIQLLKLNQLAIARALIFASKLIHY
jgi:hypothetical protein